MAPFWVCSYLGGVGVAVSSTDRRWVDNRAGFALRPPILVQAGIFKTRQDVEHTHAKHLPASTRDSSVIWKDLALSSPHFVVYLLHSKMNVFYAFCIRHVFSCSNINFRNDTRIRIYVWLIYDLLTLCSGHCVVAKNGEWGQCGVSVLCPVCSVPDGHTHTHKKAHSYHLAGLCVRCMAVPMPG